MQHTLEEIKEKIMTVREDFEKSKHILQEAQKIARLGHWEWDFRTDKITWSKEIYTMLGLEKNEVKPSFKAFTSLLHPVDQSRISRQIAQACKIKKNFSNYFRILRPDGKLRHMYCHGIFEPQTKEPIRLYGIIQDITELKSMENKMHISEMLGQESERKRISGELHDGIGQMLAAIKMQLSSLEKSLQANPNDGHRQFAEIRRAVDDTIQEVRTISHNMSPYLLKKYGLAHFLQHMCETSGPVSLSFRTNLRRQLSQTNQVILYRAAQELISNIVKHSQATKAKVFLLHESKKICLRIEDNGIGLKKDEKENGIGLMSIKSRVDLVNGVFRIESLATKGTRAEICIPE